MYLHSNRKHLFVAGKNHFQAADCSFQGSILSYLAVSRDLRTVIIGVPVIC